jgi:hypothetical protein
MAGGCASKRAYNHATMDGIFAAMAATLDPRFEVRRTESGAEVVAAKDEPLTSGTRAGDAAKKPAEVGGASKGAAGGAGSVAAGGAGAAAPKAYKVSSLPLEERFALVRSVGEECIQVRKVAPPLPHEATARARTLQSPACCCVAGRLLARCRGHTRCSRDVNVALQRGDAQF